MTMTEDELDKMELLWKRRVRVADIASKLGYTEQTVYANARMHRDRFPTRHKKVRYGDMMLWVERVRAGRCTIAEAAKALGVSYESVRKRVSGHAEA